MRLTIWRFVLKIAIGRGINIRIGFITERKNDMRTDIKTDMSNTRAPPG